MGIVHKGTLYLLMLNEKIMHRSIFFGAIISFASPRSLALARSLAILIIAILLPPPSSVSFVGFTRAFACWTSRTTALIGRCRRRRRPSSSFGGGGGGSVGNFPVVTSTGVIVAARSFLDDNNNPIGRRTVRHPGSGDTGRISISPFATTTTSPPPMTSLYARRVGGEDVDDDGGLASYLRSARSALSEASELATTADGDGDAGHRQTAAIHLILGNEAGDADSIVSAIGLGYAKTMIRRGGMRRGMTTTTPAAVVVPVVSVPRAEVHLRSDVVLLLDLAGIPIEDLVCVDDDDASRLLSPPPSSLSSSSSSSSLLSSSSSSSSSPELKLTLVDHNRLRSSLVHLSSSVVEILDHHEDEACHAGVTAFSGAREIVYVDGAASVASTCTLVTERALGGTSGDVVDASLGLLLLGVILLDSVNMSPGAGKGMA